MQLVVSAPRVVADMELLSPGGIVVEDGRIVDVFAGSPPAGDARHVALASGTLVPGLVDLQVNGYAGVDFASAAVEDWVQPARALARAGVTAFAPTLITAPVEALADGVRRSAEARDRIAAAPDAARVVATHVEGPFLAAVRRGAHSEALIVAPTRERVDALLDAAVGGPRLLVTLAPEVDGAIAAIGRLVERGALVSVGHTDARAAQVTAALDAGARMVTHLFNAQRGLHHREPGVVGAALTDPRATCGLIVDLHHVAPAVCRIAFAAAPGRIALVSDAVAAAGMPPGRYELGGRPVELGESGPPLRADGTIAGADLSLSRALANAVALGVDLVDAVRAASTVPADALGRSELGRLRPGSRADFAWLGEDLDVRATWIDGRLAHGSADPSAPGDRELVGVSR